MSNSGCPQDWWCDSQCNNDACNFDDGDCQKDGASCTENHQCESFQCSNGKCGSVIPIACDEEIILDAGDFASPLGGHNVEYIKQDYAGGVHFIDVDGENLFEPSTASAGTYVLSTGTEVKIMENLQQDYAGGEHQVKLCFNNEPEVNCAGEIVSLSAGDSTSVLGGGHNVEYIKQDYAGGVHFVDVDGEQLFEPSTASAGTYVLSSGTEVKIMGNLQQDYTGGEHQVRLCFNNEPEINCAGEIVSLSAGDSTSVLGGGHNVEYIKQDYAGGVHFIDVDGEQLFEPSTASAGTYVLSSGTKVKIMGNLQQDYAGGEHQVRLCFEN